MSVVRSSDYRDWFTTDVADTALRTRSSHNERPRWSGGSRSATRPVEAIERAIAGSEPRRLLAEAQKADRRARGQARRLADMRKGA
jgi:hypothetical protein